MTTPDLHRQTLFVLDDHGRIVSTREPGGSPGPLFAIVPGAGGCAWGVHADVRDDVAGELDRIAQTEPLMRYLREAPVHAERYMSLLEHVRSELSVSASPAFRFPRGTPASGRGPLVDDKHLVESHSSGWFVGEIAAGSTCTATIVLLRGP